jgi:putative acetyltransferase
MVAVQGLTISLVSTATAEVRLLIGELDATLAEHYAPAERHGLALAALFESHIRLFLAWADGVPVGCGGVALDDGYAEIKRMFVREAWRGQGIAQALLARLREVAAEAGRTVLRLETGVFQPAAIRLYERAGFTPCPAFGAYAAMPAASIGRSLFYEMRIGPGDGGGGLAITEN